MSPYPKYFDFYLFFIRIFKKKTCDYTSSFIPNKALISSNSPPMFKFLKSFPFYLGCLFRFK